MSGWPRIYYKLLNLPLSILVKASLFRRNPPRIGARYFSPHYVCLAIQLKSGLTDAAGAMSGARSPGSAGAAGDRRRAVATLCIYSRRTACLYLLHAKEESVKLFHDYLDLHRSNPALDVQMVPVSVMFGRAPGREKGEENPPLRMLNGVQKFFAISAGPR